ncbi:MAG TPA: xanthine dehydrogenase family protein subunit M [Casimicrobiaceae bacterium]|nr:xanthine dehydrogenase family protein subunit M [Casimicrobiaceae bacterium]
MAIEEDRAPASLADALTCLRGGDYTVLAGGTDLMPQVHAGRVKFGRGLLNITRIDTLHAIERLGSTIRIGALVTMTELMNDPLVREHFPVLAEACDHFASDQLRNAATLGGNVCNASPAGDTLVPLLVHDAVAELASKPDGRVETRNLPLAEFFVGPGRTMRAPHELLCALRLPLPAPGFTARFCKFGTRPALDISAVAIGVGGVRRGGALIRARVAYGAVAPMPMRAHRTEQALEGSMLGADTSARVAGVARDEVRPIDDVRASAWYRRELVHNLTRRMLDDVAQA